MNEKKVNQLLLERYILDELPRARKKEIHRLLEQDPDLRAELESIKRSNSEILEKYPAGAMVPGLVARQRARSYNLVKEKQKRSLKRLLYASPVLAAALVMILFLLPFGGEKPGIGGIDTTPDITRIKGDPADIGLLIYRKTHLDAERLKNGDRAGAGDLLQVAYSAGEAGYGIILSIDGNGVVTLHFPYSRGGSTALDKKKIKTFLRNAYELDNAPGFERFFFITSREELDVNAVIATAKKWAASPGQARAETLDLGGPYKQTSVLIVKGGKQ